MVGGGGALAFPGARRSCKNSRKTQESQTLRKELFRICKATNGRRRPPWDLATLSFRHTCIAHRCPCPRSMLLRYLGPPPGDLLPQQSLLSQWLREESSLESDSVSQGQEAAGPWESFLETITHRIHEHIGNLLAKESLSSQVTPTPPTRNCSPEGSSALATPSKQTLPR